MRYNLLPWMFMLLLPLTGVGQSSTSIPVKDSADVLKEVLNAYAKEYISKAGTNKDVREGTALLNLLKDSSAYKKIKQSLVNQLNLGDSSVKNIINARTKGLTSAGKDLLKTTIATTLQKTGLSSLLRPLKPSLSGKFLEFTNASMLVSGQTRPSLFDNKQSSYLNTAALNAQVSLFGIPLQGSVTRQDYFENGYRGQWVFNWSFDRQDYLKKLKEAASLKLRPEELASFGMEALNRARQQAQSAFQQKLETLNERFNGQLDDKIAGFANIDKIINSDLNALSQELLSPEYLKSQFEKEQLLQTLTSRMNLGEKVDSGLVKSLQDGIREYEGVKELLQTIKTQKDEWEQSGFLSELKKLQSEQLQNVGEWMNNPDKLKALVKDQMNLSGIQKMFMNVNGMSIGRNTVSLSPLSAYGFLNNGINIELFNNNKYLFVMAGKQKDFANLNDFRFISSSFSNDNSALGIRFGKGSIQKDHSHISLFKYQQSASNYGRNNLDFVPGSSVVATISNQLSIGGSHSLRSEVSKSSRSYRNEVSLIDSLSVGGNRGGKLLSTDNLAQQMAVTLEYEGSVEKWNMSQQLYVSYTGNDYHNPGSVFLSRGMKEIGGRVKKSFFKRKLQLSVRGNYRQYSYTGIDSKWRNFNMSFTSRLKLKKGQYLSINYQPFQSMRLQDNRQLKTGGSDRLSLEGGFRKKLGKLLYGNTLNLTLQKNDYRFDSMTANNKSVQLSSMNSLTIGNKMIFCSLVYNKVDNPSNIAFFNTSTNVDMGISYAIGKRLQASSSLGYNIVEGWYKQVGIRQSLSGQIGKRIVSSFYIDINKNLKEYRPNNMDRLRADWSMQYRLFK